ncbi:MAG: hypothetical protein ABSA31_01295 [Acidimicrobiales bacterium]
MTARAPDEAFHPAVAEWFRRTFPAGPTAAQRRSWPASAAGEDALIAAPTGSAPGACRRSSGASSPPSMDHP